MGVEVGTMQFRVQGEQNKKGERKERKKEKKVSIKKQKMRKEKYGYV
jgi:hypothetical protein